MNKWMLIASVGFVSVFVWQPHDTAGQDQDRTSMFPSGRGNGHERRPLTEEEMIQLRRQELAQEFDADTSLDDGNSINPDLMRTVIDNTTGVRYEERAAYFRTLRLAHDVPLESLERYAAEIREERRETVPSYKRRGFKDFPQFVDLFTWPEFYRGRPVTLRGVMRKLTKFNVGKNSLDLDDVYEGWVYTPDSQGHPVVVVFSSKAEWLPVNGDIQEEVRFTGYFFKMYGYDAHDTTRRAPLILAGEIECLPRPHKALYQNIGTEWYVLTAFAFLVGSYMVWQMNRRRVPSRPLPQIEPDFTHFPPLELPAPSPFLAHSISETEDS